MRLYDEETTTRVWRRQSLREWSDDVVRAAGGRRSSGPPRIVAIDGRGGAGKTILAARLSGAVARSTVVHTDDVAWHHSFFDWADLLAAEVLAPLVRGEAVEYRPPAWSDRGRPGVIAVPTGCDIVWLEGTGASRRELAEFIDAAIWVQADVVEAERRCIEREGSTPSALAFLREWQAEERPLLKALRPWDDARFIVAGTHVLDHDPATEVVVAATACR